LSRFGLQLGHSPSLLELELLQYLYGSRIGWGVRYKEGGVDGAGGVSALEVEVRKSPAAYLVKVTCGGKILAMLHTRFTT